MFGLLFFALNTPKIKNTKYIAYIYLLVFLILAIIIKKLLLVGDIMKTAKFVDSFDKEFRSWKYPDEYSVYDLPEWDAIASHGYFKKGIAKEDHIAVVDEDNNLVGVCCFQNMGKYTYVGISLKPELCNKGLGKEVLKMCMQEYMTTHPQQRLVAEIRRWNNRSLITFMKVGFKIEDIRSSLDNLGSPTRFVLMVYAPKNN